MLCCIVLFVEEANEITSLYRSADTKSTRHSKCSLQLITW